MTSSLFAMPYGTPPPEDDVIAQCDRFVLEVVNRRLSLKELKAIMRHRMGAVQLRETVKRLVVTNRLVEDRPSGQAVDADIWLSPIRGLG